MSGRRHLAWASNGLLPGRLDSRGCCSSCRKEGEAVCCVLLHVASRPLSRTDAVFQLNGRLSCVGSCRCRWAQQWLISRTGGVCHRLSTLSSASEVTALLQGEEDGRPGTVVLSNPAVRQG